MLWHRIISICYVFLSNNNLACLQYACHTFLVVKKRACDYFQRNLSNSFAFYMVWMHTETQKRYAEERRCFRLKIEKIPHVTCTEKERENRHFLLVCFQSISRFLHNNFLLHRGRNLVVVCYHLPSVINHQLINLNFWYARWGAKN